MSFLSMYCIIETVQLMMCVVALQQVMQSHRSRKTMSTPLLLAIWVFYCSAILFAVSRVSTTLCYCFAPYLLDIPWNLVNFSYSIHLITLLFILFERLRSVFGWTACLRSLSATIILIFAAGSSMLILVAVEGGVDFYWMLIGLLVFAVLVIAQVLAWLLVYKLLQMRKNTIQSSQSSDEKVQQLVRKYAVLSVISVTFSTFAALIIIVFSTTGATGSQRHFMAEFFAGFVSLDVFLDSLCMTLSLSVNDKHYRSICAPFVSKRRSNARSRLKSAESLQCTRPFPNEKTLETGHNAFSMIEPPSFAPGDMLDDHHRLDAPRASKCLDTSLCVPIIDEKDHLQPIDLLQPSKSAPTLSFQNFAFQTQSESTSCNNFHFGVYLEYWRGDRSNSVHPKYRSFKEELTQNVCAALTEDEYGELYAECEDKLTKHSATKANNLGARNIECQIAVGSRMRMSHMMSVTIYTDYSQIQCEFKKRCRKAYRGEPLAELIVRNAEIAHWCRALKESIMFFGRTMSANECVFSGMAGHLLFDSMYQRFECPLSTTKSERIATHRFAGDTSGVTLKLKRGNSQTRCLDVTRFSCFPGEQERLFMGSTLKIVSLLIGRTSLFPYISALAVLERTMNGQFIDAKPRSIEILLSLIARVVNPLLMEDACLLLDSDTLRAFLVHDEYDSDALKLDLGDVDSSIICGKAKHIDKVEALQRVLDVVAGLCIYTHVYIKACYYIFLSHGQRGSPFPSISGTRFAYICPR